MERGDSTMTIQMEYGDGATRNLLRSPQQLWRGPDPEVMQYAKFAGQTMMAVRPSKTNPDSYVLHFMGFVAVGFASMAEAKESAPIFAKEVLAYLAGTIEGTEDESQPE